MWIHHRDRLERVAKQIWSSSVVVAVENITKHKLKSVKKMEQNEKNGSKKGLRNGLFWLKRGTRVELYYTEDCKVIGCEFGFDSLASFCLKLLYSHNCLTTVYLIP